MKKNHQRLILFFLCLLMMGLPLGASATTFGYNRVYNYPAITFVVLGASSDVDMRVTLFDSKGIDFRTMPEKEHRLWENYFRIYRQGVEGRKAWFGNQRDFKDAVIHIQDRDKSYDFPMPYEQLQEKAKLDYIFINLRTGKLSVGTPIARRLALFVMHLLLYMLIESYIFWRMNFREPRSWRFFLIYTAITKGLVCIFIRKWIDVDARFYIVFAALTLFLLVVDIAVFLFALDEDRNKIGKFAGVANVVAGFLVYEAMIRLPM